MHTPPKDPKGDPVAGLSATISPAGTNSPTQKPPERSGRTLFTVLNKSDSGWLSRGKARDDASTMKQVDNVLDLLRKGRF